MKNISIHLLLLLELLSSINSQRHTYIIPTEPTSVSVQCPEDDHNANITRCLTLNELIDSPLGEHGTFRNQEEVVFLSGVHIVNGTENVYESSEESSNLVLRGESNEVTIVCLKPFTFVFAQSRYIKVSNLTLINCAMNKEIWYKANQYWCNYTLLYIGLKGSMIIENVLITTKSRVAIAVYVEFDMNQLCN